MLLGFLRRMGQTQHGGGGLQHWRIMAFEIKEGTTCLFRNHKKFSDKSPDFKGEILINGKAHVICAWERESQKGGTFLSLTLQTQEQANAWRNQPKQDQPARRLPKDGNEEYWKSHPKQNQPQPAQAEMPMDGSDDSEPPF